MRAPTVSRRATISMTTNSTVKMMTEGSMENTATEPSAKMPDTAPPEVI